MVKDGLTDKFQQTNSVYFDIFFKKQIPESLATYLQVV